MGILPLSEKVDVKKRGNKLGFWFFKITIQAFGLRGAYGLLYIVCFYYLLFDRAAVRNALAYVSRRFKGDSIIKLHWHAYLLFVNQGKALVDRHATTAGYCKFNIISRGYESMRKALKEEFPGAILLASHVGNWQITLSSIDEQDRSICFVMKEEDNRAVEKSLNIDQGTSHIEIILSDGDFGGAIEITNNLNHGDIVFMMGDRKYNFQSLKVKYMGGMAEFPYGAFLIAAAVKCPVIVFLTAKLPGKDYLVDFKHVFYPKYKKGISKMDQIAVWVQEYVVLLEEYSEKYPYQCFLFSDIWDK